jgi:hypothetical protein
MAHRKMFNIKKTELKNLTRLSFKLCMVQNTLMKYSTLHYAVVSFAMHTFTLAYTVCSLFSSVNLLYCIMLCAVQCAQLISVCHILIIEYVM